MSLVLFALSFIFVVSLLTFAALFGRLPAFRYTNVFHASSVGVADIPSNTPIGHLYRLLWIHIPHHLRLFDAWLTQGRLTRSFWRFSQYLMNERHPLVMVGVSTTLLAL